MLIMPTSFPLSIIGTCEMPCSLIRLSTAPTDLFASIVYGAFVIISLILVLPHCWVTAPWMMFSSVMKPNSFFPSKTGSCLTPLSIMSLAALLRDVVGSTLGAGRIRVLTFVDAGSSPDLIIHRLVITPAYLPLSSKTARTGGISFLNKSKHLDSASFS